MTSMHQGVQPQLMRIWIGICLVAAMQSTTSAWAQEKELAFVRDVLPIIQAKCVGCHSDQDPQSGLSLSNAR